MSYVSLWYLSIEEIVETVKPILTEHQYTVLKQRTQHSDIQFLLESFPCHIVKYINRELREYRRLKFKRLGTTPNQAYIDDLESAAFYPHALPPSAS